MAPWKLYLCLYFQTTLRWCFVTDKSSLFWVDWGRRQRSQSSSKAIIVAEGFVIIGRRLGHLNSNQSTEHTRTASPWFLSDICTYLNFWALAAGNERPERKRDIRPTLMMSHSEDLPSLTVIKIIPGSFTYLKGFQIFSIFEIYIKLKNGLTQSPLHPPN